MAPGKVQREPPWKYLGWIISGTEIRPQKIKITTQIKPLSGTHKLMGDIQWARPLCGITNDDLAALMPLLKGESKADQERVLSRAQ